MEYKLETIGKNTPLNIGGWLALFAIGMVLYPLKFGIALLVTYPGIFFLGYWDKYAVTTSEHYLPYFGILMIGEFVVGLIYLTLLIIVSIKFFKKRKNTVKWFVCISILSIANVYLFAIASSYVIPNKPFLSSEASKDLLIASINLFFWSPYLWFSKRSKLTFVN